MNTKTITPIHVCDLIAHETVSLLSVLDEDAVPPAQWMRDGLALYAAAHQLEEETARHLNWIDDEIQRIRQTAAGQELILLIGDEQLVRTAGLPMQIEAVRELLHTTAQLESVESRTALLELARTVTDLCGMEDALTANGDEAVHRMEQVWELFRGAVSAEHAERRQTLLEEADIQMDELCGCLDPEAEVEDGKQLLTWEELRSELEGVAGALEASEQDAVPRLISHSRRPERTLRPFSFARRTGIPAPCALYGSVCRFNGGVTPCHTCEGRASVEAVCRKRATAGGPNGRVDRGDEKCAG